MAGQEDYLWKDPFNLLSSGPVLLSDHIHFLADEVGLIEPFSEKHLRPAAYDLSVGDAYYVDDERKDLTDESNEITIPPNGLVYVKTKERFNVPYYLVARYSLRVHQVYRGLLIDNGLHIDPGYCGYIWIPVHNFTMQPRVLQRDAEFISVEFNRTTRLPGIVYSIENQDELVKRGIRDELRGSNGRAVKVFWKDFDQYQRRRSEITPRIFWDKFPGEKHKSGTLATDERMITLEQQVTQAATTTEKQVRDSQGRVDTFVTLTFTVVAVLFTAIGIIATKPSSDSQSFLNSPVWVAGVALWFALRANLERRRDGTPQSASRFGWLSPPLLAFVITGLIVASSIFLNLYKAHVSAVEIQAIKVQSETAVAKEKQDRESAIRELERQSQAREEALRQRIEQLERKRGAVH
jgi:deoxycytidine triphosphate deaminase